MTYDPRAVALLDTRMADPLGLPRMLVRAVGFGESGLQFTPKRGDGGRAVGLLQIRTDIHGMPAELWEGEAGAIRSIDYMTPRWRKQGVPVAVAPAAWDMLDFTGRAAVLKAFWHAANGASQAAVAGRAAQVLRETEALFAGETGGVVVTKPDIKWFPAHPDNFTVGRPEGVNYEGLVIHTTAGGASLEALGSWFGQQQTVDGKRVFTSTHFGVGPDGRIGQFVSLSNTAHAHGFKNKPTAAIVHENELHGVNNPNDYLIGIELVDGGTPGNHTAVQLEAAAQLAAWLCETELLPHAAQTGFTISRERFIGHREIDSVNRAQCPSWSSLRYTDFIARVRALLAQPVPPPPIDYHVRLLTEMRGWHQAMLDNLGIVNDLKTRLEMQEQDVARKLAELEV